MLRDPAADARDELAASSGVPELGDKIWFHKTASAVIEPGRCVGCGGCIAACPSDSLTVAADGKPTLVRMCTGCSACWDYCPLAGLRVERLASISDGEAQGELGPLLAAYSARANDPAARAQDGGIVTALLAALLESGHIDGAIVTRRLDAFRGETVLATTPEEVREAAGSVYQQTNPLAILNRKLPEGVSNVAMVGTPCQINVLRALQRYPWRYRESAAAAVGLTIALFCTRSFDPVRLARALAEHGENIADVARLDVRDGTLYAHGESGRREVGPVRKFREAALAGCDECADFAGNLADISVGNLGSEPGASTALVRTEAGRNAWDAAEGALVSRPLKDLSPVETMHERNRRRAERSLERDFDPHAPLWISYQDHLEAYEGTDREPVPAPPHRSHHYDVSC